MVETAGAMRIDRWLWAARFFPSRSLAAAACSGGKVDVNGEAAKPARPVRPGDLVAVTVGPGRRRIARVLGLAERRGPAGAARRLYEDLTPPEPPRPPAAARPYRQPGAGRPTKRERRQLDRLRGG
jgi:ribosome-associated heat shock protein Hsp15